MHLCLLVLGFQLTHSIDLNQINPHPSWNSGNPVSPPDIKSTVPWYVFFFPEESSENRISRVAVAYSDVPLEENGNAGMWRPALSALTRAWQPRHHGIWSSTAIKLLYLSIVQLFYFRFFITCLFEYLYTHTRTHTLFLFLFSIIFLKYLFLDTFFVTFFRLLNVANFSHKRAESHVWHSDIGVVFDWMLILNIFNAHLISK